MSYCNPLRTDLTDAEIERIKEIEQMLNEIGVENDDSDEFVSELFDIKYGHGLD